MLTPVDHKDSHSLKLCQALALTRVKRRSMKVLRTIKMILEAVEVLEVLVIKIQEPMSTTMNGVMTRR